MYYSYYKSLLPIILVLSFVQLKAQYIPHANNEYFHGVSIGNVPGASSEVKFGFNTDVDNAAEEDIWAYGGNLSYLISAEPMVIASSSTADDDGNTGALTIVISGLDADYKEITETIFMDGQSAVETTDTFIRVHRMYVETAGSGGTNAGNITAIAKSASTVQAYIPANYGQTQQAIYTVPNNTTCYVVGLQLSGQRISVGGAAPNLEFHSNIRTYGGAWRRVFTSYLDTGSQSYTDVVQLTQSPIPERTDIRVSCETSTDDSVVSARLFLVCYDN